VHSEGKSTNEKNKSCYDGGGKTEGEKTQRRFMGDVTLGGKTGDFQTRPSDLWGTRKEKLEGNVSSTELRRGEDIWVVDMG